MNDDPEERSVVGEITNDVLGPADGTRGAAKPLIMSEPTWMDISLPRVEHRRGAVPLARSSLPTWLFFGVIVLAVGAAGILAMAVWGPDKTPRNRTQFATHPEPPPAAVVEPTPAPEPVVASASEEAAPEAPAAAPTPPPKKAKKVVRTLAGKKR